MKRKFLLFTLLIALILPVYFSIFSPSKVKANEKENINLERFLNFESVVQSINQTPIKEKTLSPLSNEIVDSNNQLAPAFVHSLEEQESYALLSESGVKTYSNYALKRIIVQGNLDCYKENVVASYNNLHILSFDSEEQTKSAYKSLIKNNNLNVVLDKVISTQDYADIEYDYTNYKNIGAKAIDIAGYRKYLVDENVTKEVVAVVIDTGLNTSHEMFNGRLLTENGKIRGYSYFNSKYTYSASSLAFDEDDTNRRSFEDDNGHGTHVAGIICSLTPSNVKILPIKIGDPNADNNSSKSVMLAAYLRVINIYSTQYKVVCTNLSFSGAGKSNNEERDLFNEQCYEPLMNKKILPITAAGNSSAECDIENLKAVVVSSIRQIGNNYEFDYSYSNFGKIVDISAPGTDIYSAWIAETNQAAPTTYKTEDGTSMASPQVAAVAALLALDPLLDNVPASVIEQKLYDLSLDLGEPGKDKYYGHGMVNLKFFKVQKAESLRFFADGIEVNSYPFYKNFSTDFSLTITCTNLDYEIIYTTDESFPNASSSVYTSPITIDKTTFVYAMGVKKENGKIVKRTSLYNVSYFKDSTPVEDCFEIDENGTLTRYTGHYTSLIIPSVVDGIDVVSFAPSLFKRTSLQSVIIPDCVTTISGWAFSNCYDLKYIYAPKVTKIFIAAFQNCTSLPTVYSRSPQDGEIEGCFIPKVTELISHTFAGCTSLHTALLQGIPFAEDNGGYHFANCENLSSIRVSNSNNMPQFMFYNCKKLFGSITITNLNSVGIAAFYGCNITKFTVDGEHANLYTDGKGLYNPTSIIAFANGNKNTEYTILSSVTINKTAYTITKIEQYALATCSFKTLTIPSNIQVIGEFAIKETALDTVNYNAYNLKAEGYWNEAMFGRFQAFPDEVNKIVIGANVKQVPKHLFHGVSYKNLVINSYSTTLGEMCFHRESDAEVNSIYLNFTQTMSRSYRIMLEETSCLFATDKINTIYSKAQINLTLTPRITKSTYPYEYFKDTYYIYSKMSLADYTIVATCGENGSISPAGTKEVFYGDDITYTFSPSTGYRLYQLFIDNKALTTSEVEEAAKNGYTFVDILENHTIHATFVTLTNIKYTVNHLKHSFTTIDAVQHNGKHYKIYESELLYGQTDSPTTASSKTYTGFKCLGVTQSTIAGDGSTIINIYYDRLSYNLTLLTSYGIESVSGGGQMLFEQEVSAIAVVKQGYKWTRWESSFPEIVNHSDLSTYNFKMPNMSITLTARASELYYTVNFYNDNASQIIKTQNVKYNAAAIPPTETPTKPSTVYYDYEFEGWFTSVNGSVKADLTHILGDTNVYAKFKSTIKKFTVTFYNYDNTVLKVNGQDKQYIQYGGAPNFPQNLSKPSTTTSKFVFEKWLTKQGANVANFSIIEDTEFYASYKKYSIVTLDFDCAIVTAEEGRALIHVADFKSIGDRKLKVLFDNDNIITIDNENLFKISIKNKDVLLTLSTEPFDLSSSTKAKVSNPEFYNFNTSVDGKILEDINYLVSTPTRENIENLAVWSHNNNEITKVNYTSNSDNTFSFLASTNNTYIIGEEKKSAVVTILLIISGAGAVATPTTIIIIKIVKKSRRGLLM